AEAIDRADDPVLRARRTAAFRGLLDDLPEEQAETFALRVVLDYSLDQVAAATGAPVNTVRSRVRLAREKLKQRIERDPELWDMLRGEA
ncbi:MAG TPA: sigma factor-like helix-turn-helix DNA-binding protein, partial [Polyangia bacterium]|nr:sigma factor-like helix-turn-helix DNA-binding protein [Polyangia bacterium]